MGVVAVVTVSFIIVGDINFLAPIVTMPFLLTYACIDYSYFALAQTFDIQEQREERFRIQASSPSYETRRYGAAQSPGGDSNDLDLLFPDRVRHKNLQQTPQNSPHHVPSNVASTAAAAAAAANAIATANQETERNHIQQQQYGSDGYNTTNAQEASATEQTANDEEPIAPIRLPIHSKTKNWYSPFCNRWASLLGVSVLPKEFGCIFMKSKCYIFHIFIADVYETARYAAGQLVLCAHMLCCCVHCLVLCGHC